MSRTAFKISSLLSLQAANTIGVRSDVTPSLANVTPSTGLTAGTVCIPQISVQLVRSVTPIPVTYGRVTLKANNTYALAAGASITITIGHTLNTTNYFVMVMPELQSSISVDVGTLGATGFGVTVTNKSGTIVRDPAFVYMLMQAPFNNTMTTLAPPLNVPSTNVNLGDIYTSLNRQTPIEIPITFATDPAGYPIQYTLSRNTSGMGSITITGSAIYYTPAWNTETSSFDISATNTYTPATVITVNYTEKIITPSYIRIPGNATFTVSTVPLSNPPRYTASLSTNVSSLERQWQLPMYSNNANSNNLLLTYTVDTVATIATAINTLSLNITNDNILKMTTSTTGTRTIVLTCSFSSDVMATTQMQSTTLTLTIRVA
jgi:hypothetical protein